jgi:hypothetical protein
MFEGFSIILGVKGDRLSGNPHQVKNALSLGYFLSRLNLPRPKWTTADIAETAWLLHPRYCKSGPSVILILINVHAYAPGELDNLLMITQARI